MKAFLASAVSLILGLGLGWHFEHHRAEREKTEIVQQMVEGGESADRLLAVMAARAIQMVESGQSQQAVQMLASPIAHYYTLYTGVGTKEERRAETRALIEQLSKTNRVVAARIAEISTYSEAKTP
jgi:hypothetical protein